MNAEQLADPTQNAQSRLAMPGEANPIVNSILARARWMQRALSPWTQHWLSQANEPAGPSQSAAPSGQALPSVFTTGAVQQTLSRIQAQYGPYASRSVAEEANALPLVGAPSQLTSTPAAASGPYSKPFNSLEDFLAAVEASKERTDTPPPTENAKPAPQRTQGPYSKPFNSLEEFLKATEAAKARNYAPPPAEKMEPPAPPREAGPYSHAFTSFEEFVKAVEESRQQWGYTAPQTVQPEQTSSPPGKIRPISRVEELPTRDNSTLVNIPASTAQVAPQVAPQPNESFSIPDQLPTTTLATEAFPLQSDSAILTAPALTSAPTGPAVIPPFSPAKARGGPAPRGPAPRGPAPRGTPPRASGSQPVQRTTTGSEELPAPVEPVPATSPTSPVTPLRDVAITVPESSAESALPPFVQPQTAESASALVPVDYEATSSDAPLTTRPSVEPLPTPSMRGVPPEQRPAIDHVPANAAQETRAAATPQATPQPASTPVAVAPAAKVVAASSPTSRGRPSAISGTPSVQREVEETAQDEFGSSGAEPSAAPDVQRHVAEPAQTALPIDQSSSEWTVSSINEEPAATTALPIVQRHVSEPSISPVASDVEAWPEVTPTQADMPLAQRRTAATRPAPATPARPGTPIPAHPETSPGSDTLPVVQQLVSEPPTSAVASEVAREDEGALPSTPADFTPARSALNMPLAQRKSDQAKPMPSTPPVVQRDASESQVVAPVAEAALEEEILPTTLPEPTPARSARSMPLAQRKLDQANLPPSTSSVAQRLASKSQAAVFAAEPAMEEEAVMPTTTPEVTPTRSARSVPLAQRELDQAKLTPSTSLVVERLASESQAAAFAAEPAVEEEAVMPTTTPGVTPTRSVHSVPLAQRKLDQAKLPPSTSSVVQRLASESQAAAFAAEPAVEEEAVMPTTTPEVTPTRSARSVPLAQRELDQAKLPPSTSSVVQRLASESQAAALAAEPAVEEEAVTPTTTPEVTPTRSARSVPLAQRHTIEAEMVAPPQPPEAATEARGAFPPAQIAPPSRSEMPLVQRHIADTQPVEEEPIQRQLGEPPSPAGAAPLPDQTATNISDRILARVVGHEHIPAAKLPDLPLHQPVPQRVSAPEAKAASQLVKSEFVAAVPAPPVSVPAITPAIQRTPEPVIQRTPTEPSTTSQEAGFIQRVESGPAEPGPEAPEPVDLDNLARQVYPIIKHMLAVERERRSFR